MYSVYSVVKKTLPPLPLRSSAAKFERPHRSPAKSAHASDSTQITSDIALVLSP